jgi:hypothetical protein
VPTNPEAPTSQGRRSPLVSPATYANPFAVCGVEGTQSSNGCTRTSTSCAREPFLWHT